MATPCQCDPCSQLDIHYRDSMSWRKAMLVLLCRLAGSSSPAKQAEFVEAVSLGVGDIGAAYAHAATLADARKLMVDNQTDGDVWLSMDGGVTDHFYLRSGQNLNIDFFALGLSSSAVIHVRDGSVVPASGICFIYAVN